jgi:hypothetical protein
LLTSLIRPLHARFGAHRYSHVGPWSEPLLSGQPGVGEILTVRSRKTPYWLAPDQRAPFAGCGPAAAGPDLAMRRQ